MGIVYKYKGNKGDLFTVKIIGNNVEIASTSHLLFSDGYVELLKKNRLISNVKLISNSLVHYYVFVFKKEPNINEVHDLHLPFINLA